MAAVNSDVQVRVDAWARLEITIKDELLQEAIAEVLSNDNRYYAWQKLGENLSLEQLIQFYVASGGFNRLIARRQMVKVRDRA